MMGIHTEATQPGRQVVGVVVCVLLVAAGAGAGVAAAQEGGDLRFDETVTTEQRGDVATVTLRLGDRRHAALSVSAPDGTYRTRVRVADGDGDGRVTVEINTFRAGWAADPEAAYAVGDGDELRSVDRTTRRLDGPLPSGRYNLVVAAGSDSTAASLVLRPGTLAGATTGTAPGTRLSGAANVTESDVFRTGRVATGDFAVVAFNATGVGGLLASSPPAANLVYPTDSTPDRSTVHTVGVDADRSVVPESVTVRYETGAPGRLSSVDAERIEHLGVDTDGDGIVETDLRPAIRGVSETDRGVTLDLETDATVAAGETLLLAYRVRNPDEPGTHAVRAVVDGRDATVSTDGRVVYGPAGRGTLGYGHDLRFTADGEPVVDPLAAVDYRYVDDRLYAVVNTSALSVGERYGVGLIRWGGANPLGTGTAAANGSVRVTERRATLVDPAPDDGGFVVGAGERTFRMETTLAPTTEVVVQMSGESQRFLFRRTTTVGTDRRFATSFEFPTDGGRQSVTLRVVADGRVVGLAQGTVDPTRDND
jgi:hypothetical protein